MSKKYCLLFASVIFFSITGSVFADGNSALVIPCTTCHMDKSNNENIIPPLAGYSKTDILEKLMAFKTAESKITVMQRVMKGYSDEEIKLIATALTITEGSK